MSVYEVNAKTIYQVTIQFCSDITVKRNKEKPLGIQTFSRTDEHCIPSLYTYNMYII